MQHEKEADVTTNINNFETTTVKVEMTLECCDDILVVRSGKKPIVGREDIGTATSVKLQVL